MRSAGFLGLGLLGTITAAPTLAHALTVEFSSPSYSLFHGITESEIGEDFATFAVQERRGNETGDISLTSDIGYATAYSESDSFHLRASSSVDGSSLTSLGLDSVSSEGGAYFDIDFVVTGVAPVVLVDIAYDFSSSFVSTDPRSGLGEPGTNAIHGLRSIRVWDENEIVLATSMQQGSHVFSGEVETGKVYQLKIRLNAVSSARDSTGAASAQGAFDAEISARPVPEPALAVLLGGALAALACLRLPRGGRRLGARAGASRRERSA